MPVVQLASLNSTQPTAKPAAAAQAKPAAAMKKKPPPAAKRKPPAKPKQQTSGVTTMTLAQFEKALGQERIRYHELEKKLKKETKLKMKNEATELKKSFREVASSLKKENTELKRSLKQATAALKKANKVAAAAAASPGEKKIPKSRQSRIMRSPNGEKIPSKFHADKWYARYEELKAYKEEHGHCNVKKLEHYQLFMWIARTRMSYHKQRKGEKDEKGMILTEERLKVLNDLNFEWRVRKNMPLAWEERYIQLLEYRDLHGHCRVKQNHSDPQGLGHWVFEQRKVYQKLLLGKKTYNTLSPERIAKLESVGFVWSLKNAGERSGL